MPTYTFRNKNTEEIFDKIMSWNSREEYLKEKFKCIERDKKIDDIIN
jgi:hypothetical protein